MADRGHHDLSEVGVDKPVENFAPGTLPGHHAGGFEHPQMLAHQWLGQVEGFDQLVDAAL